MLLYRTQVVYRLRPGVKLDSYGDPVEDLDNPERERLVGAYVQSGQLMEDPDRLLAGQRKLFAPGSHDLKAEDLIEVDGELWRVEGDARIRHGLAMGTYTAAILSKPSRRYPKEVANGEGQA